MMKKDSNHNTSWLPRDFKIIDAALPWGLDGEIEVMGKNEGDYVRLTPPRWLRGIMADCYQAGRASLKTELQTLLGIRE